MTTSQALAADPAGTALAALSHLPPGPLAVHIDIDVLDFTDSPPRSTRWHLRGVQVPTGVAGGELAPAFLAGLTSAAPRRNGRMVVLGA